MNKFFVLDTNVFLDNPACIEDYKEVGRIAIPFKVLAELDNQKSKGGSKGFMAREAIRNIASYQDTGFVEFIEGDSSLLPHDLPYKKADNQILSAALALKHEKPDCEIEVVTRDTMMVLLCNILALNCTKLRETGDLYELVDNPYVGYREVVVDEETIDELYGVENPYILEEDFEGEEIFKNQYLIFICENPKKKFFARFTDWNQPLRRLKSLDNDYRVWNLTPKNLEQALCLDALMDPDIPVVSLVGLAGSGKTLLSLAAGLQQIFNRTGNKKRYKRMIVSRPIQTMGKDMGYLPGTLEEKMEPWIAPIMDNLGFLSDGQKDKVAGWMESGRIEVEALAYIRGRSIPNSFILIDEAQNLTIHEIKTILTRIGEGTKIVLTGDIEQIDNPGLTQYSNGMSYVIEKLKSYDITSHVTLIEGERSKVATIAAKVL